MLYRFGTVFSCTLYFFQKLYFVYQMLWGSCIVLKINPRQPSIVFSHHNIQQRYDQLSLGFSKKEQFGDSTSFSLNCSHWSLKSLVILKGSSNILYQSVSSWGSAFSIILFSFSFHLSKHCTYLYYVLL